MKTKTDFEKCYDYMFEAQHLISEAQWIFEVYDIPFTVACPGDANCLLDDCMGELEKYVNSLEKVNYDAWNG
jgi:hypothetical protein